MADGDQQLNVKIEDGALTIRGGELKVDPGSLGGASWTAEAIDEKRLLLTLSEGKAPPTQGSLDFSCCSSEVCMDLLLALNQSGWSGLVTADTGMGVKKIYFSSGEIVFAGSNIMDDRLGEVIYREARITLDELTDSAAQVTKNRKFGQVLLATGIFNNVDLWNALKLQVQQIVRSVFMVDRVFIEMNSQAAPAPTEVQFDSGTEHLIADSFSFASSFRDFLSRLRAESEVVMLRPREEMLRLYKPGTFTGDLISMIAEQSNVQMLLNASKLIDTYTIAALINLVNQGLCTVKPAIESEKKSNASLAPLKGKIDAYGFVLQHVRKAFGEAKKPFPIDEVVDFAAALNTEGFQSLFVDQVGAIGRECISGILSQCQTNGARQRLFVRRIESLIKFLLQVAGDNLDFPVAKALRQEYRSITS